MQTQRLRKTDFLTGKMQWRKRKDFKSTNCPVEAAARYVTAPARVMVDIRDLLSERNASKKNRNRKILLSILSNIRYFPRQALPLRGDCYFFSSFYTVIMHTIGCLINPTRSLICDSFISGIPISRKCFWYFCADFCAHHQQC